MSIKLPEGAGVGPDTNSFNEEDDIESGQSDFRVDEALDGLEGAEDLGVEFPEIPEITQMGSDFPGFFRTLLPNTKAAMTSDDIGKAEVFENAFKDDDRWGGKYQDRYGLPIIVWNKKPYYINNPGFTGTDFNTVLGEMLKYLPAAKWASGASTLIGTVGRGVLGYSSTEVASKIGEAYVTPETVASRDPSLVDVASDVGLMTGIGVGADVVLPPTVKYGAQAIKATTRGLGSGAKKVRDIFLPKFEPSVITDSKYPLTQGQRTAKPPEGVTPQQTEQLGQEDIIRQSASSDLGTVTIRGFDDMQLGQIRSDALKLQDEFGAGTVGADAVYSNIPLAAAEEIQTVVGRQADELRMRKDKAYEDVATAPVQPVMSPRGVNEVAQEVLGEYRKIFSAGQLDSGPLKKEVNFLRKLIKMSENPKFQDITLKNLNGYQKRLGTAIKQAPIGSAERLALERMKRVTDDGIYNGIERGFITGDQAVLDQLQNASALYKNYMGLTGKTVGKTSQEKAANKILSQLTDKNYTPLQVANLLFGHNKFAPSQAVPLALSKLRNTLPEKEFLEVQALLKDAVLTKAFAGKGGEITRTAIVKNFNDVFNKQNAVIKELFTPDEILRIKQFRQDVLPTLWAEVKLNPSGSGYTMIAALARQQLLSFPNPLVRAGASTFLKSLDEAKTADFAIDAVRQTLRRFQSPLITQPVTAIIRPEVRDETSPADAKLIRGTDFSNLQGSLQDFQVPQIDQPLFETESDLAPTELLSPTILPDERDREIAMRQQLGIAGLV